MTKIAVVLGDISSSWPCQAEGTDSDLWGCLVRNVMRRGRTRAMKRRREGGKQKMNETLLCV